MVEEEEEEAILRIKTKDNKKKIMVNLIRMNTMSKLLHVEAGIEIKIIKEIIKKVVNVDEVAENIDKNKITEINKIVMLMKTAKAELQTQNIDKSNKMKIDNEEVDTKTNNKIIEKTRNKIILMVNHNNKDTNRKAKAAEGPVEQPDKAS